jgi:hypothetical protein
MGFWNFKHLLCYAGVVYGGNLDEVANIPRKVTWFEDWTETLTPGDEQRRTGFWNIKHLLCYAAVVYGRNLDEVAETARKVTWFEELVIYFEFSWAGGAKQWWHDYERKYACTEKLQTFGLNGASSATS